jgi:predicted Rdx family selenoprotein
MAEILKNPELEPLVASFTLVPSDGGRFEFSVDGNLLYSKLQTGRHIVDTEITNILKAHLAGE